MSDRRLIEAGFPCHQVGGETRRERDSGLAPPTHRLHVWWARRPLTPSRAAIAGSLLPEGSDTSEFVKMLGIEQKCAVVDDELWILTGDMPSFIEQDANGEHIVVDSKVQTRFSKEIARRKGDREVIERLKDKLDEHAQKNNTIQYWEHLSKEFPRDSLVIGERLAIERHMGNPAWFNQLMQIAKPAGVRVPNLYGYDRAYQNDYIAKPTGLTVLDPTSGGGSIPFEALRLGHNVIANELNPVASTILHATLDFPARFGEALHEQIEYWGSLLEKAVDEAMSCQYGTGNALPVFEKQRLINHLRDHESLIEDFDREKVTTFLYTRQVTCPSCSAKTPLLNTCWLSKEAKDPWGVKVVTSGTGAQSSYRFEVYQAKGNKGPQGEDPELGTVKRGIGQCVHCKQAIEGDEIKAQARGESVHGQWRDQLYAVVAVRHQPKRNKQGNPEYFKSGERKGEIKTEKVRFFRAPNTTDQQAIDHAATLLKAKWDHFDALGLIPTEKFPAGNDMRPAIYGMERWYKLFNGRQLLGHLHAMEALHLLKPKILAELGEARGRAVVTYLQFAIDKTVDYNSKQTRWHFGRGVIVGTFGRHDFSLKWTYGEIVLSGPNSGMAWGLSQVLDAYQGIAKLSENTVNLENQKLQIINGSGVYLSGVSDNSVDLVCMDPPYYDNVQYSELSDFYYVWQKRTLKDLYPEINWPRLTNKREEAVANPTRDGSAKDAKAEYEKLMGEIFSESRRVVKDDGVMTLMFTHKAQDAWETLTRSLILAGWEITSCFPVESESGHSTHQMNMASAASTIFITCRKRQTEHQETAFWSGLGGSGVQQQIRAAVENGLEEFKPLRLNAVDQMIACYGRALQVLSEHWPVMDGDEAVSPIRAMNEASRVVAAHQITEITDGRIAVDDLDTETAMALTIYGIWGHNDVAFSEVLNLSRSLNISLETRTGGYGIEGPMVGINTDLGGRKAVAGQVAEDKGYAAPLVKKGSKLRLSKPDERSARRLANPQSDWDVLHGVLLRYREGDVPVARAYLDEQREGNDTIILDLLEVWSEEAETPKARTEAKALLFGLKQTA
ncbi:DUF1156 domain-containing protein [Candidatus Sororendozoicomonas aggregata]|uniref:DUF1156 domain-containing protein n=1 Tax=Candidatus Sororendozoicomonas aggregata TaxID=3073239 RepID=UPI002ED15BD9